jgi:hypothetical protein
VNSSKLILYEPEPIVYSKLVGKFGGSTIAIVSIDL